MTHGHGQFTYMDIITHQVQYILAHYVRLDLLRIQKMIKLDLTLVTLTSKKNALPPPLPSLLVADSVKMAQRMLILASSL